MSGHMAVSTLRRRLLGVLFIATLVGFVTLSVAIYNKAFSSSVSVRLTTDKIGNQLTENSDVKVRGMLIGSVRKITPTGHGAELELALDPAKVALVPSNVSARFLPKTLFGERYVALQIPDKPSVDPLRQGDEIEQDRSAGAVEVEKALNDLLPVLQAVQPQKLSSTLTAISTALQGRGKPLGETLAELGQYVGEINPHLPQLQRDLRTLADVSNTYSDAAPQLVQALSDLTVTSKTIVDKRAELNAMYGNLTTASTDLRSFLAANRNNIIQLADSSRPTLELLAKYSPEYPCLFKQMADLVPLADKAFGKGTSEPGLHVTVEVVVNRGPYRPGKDEPRYDDKRGPNCYDPSKFPNPFPQTPPGGPIKDGTSSTAAGKSSSTVGGSDAAGTTSPSSVDTPTLPNSPEERQVVSQLLAAQLGTSAGDVPAWQALLVAPVFRGAEVTIR